VYHTAMGGEPERKSSSSKKEAASCVDMPKSKALCPLVDLCVLCARVFCAHGRFVGGSRVLVEGVKGLRFRPGRSEIEGGF
jgi:hypothetical protein